MYSQNNEEQTILQYFGLQPTGRFLDIGAYDGLNLSNTMALYEHGWSGVLVEASPTVFCKLMETYRDRDRSRVQLVNSAVVPYHGHLMTFHDSGIDAIGTLEPESKTRWKGIPWYPIMVNPITIIDLLDVVGYDFDMITMDVEGINLELFLSLPLAMLKQLRMIVIEHDGHVVKMTEHLGKEWTLIDFNPENAIYVKNG